MRTYLSLKTFSVFSVFLLAGLMLFNARYALAQLWVEYESDSGIFSVKAPEEYETNISEFLVDDNRAISSEEMSALIDQRPFKNVIKGYIVRADQTIGGGMSDKQIEMLLERELDLYEDFYIAHGGRIKSRNNEKQFSHAGGEFMITYDDPEFGTQVVKVRVVFSRSTRLEQIMIVPIESVNSIMNRDFYESLRFFDGLKVTDQTLKFVWEQKPSPLRIFTVNVPPVADPYFPFPPKIQYGKDAEIISLLFRDPVRNESLYYNIYSYKFDRFISGTDIQNLIVKNHVLKHNADPGHIRLSIEDERLTITTPPRKYRRKIANALFNIPAVPDFPFLQTVKLQAFGEGQILVVQEAISSQPLVLSPFIEVLFKNLVFHPDDYQVPLTDMPVSTGTHAMDVPMMNTPGGTSLTEKLRSAITITDAKTPKPKRDPNKPLPAPLPDTLPANEVLPDIPVQKPHLKAPQPAPAPDAPTPPGGSALPPATP